MSGNMSTAPPADDRQYPWKAKQVGDKVYHPSPLSDSNNNKSQPTRLFHHDEPQPQKPPTNTHAPDSHNSPKHPPRKSTEEKPRGSLYKVLGTQQVVGEKNREAYVKVTIRELCIYIVYLTIVCIVTFGPTSSSSYYFTKVMMDLFVDVDIRPQGQDQKTFADSVTLDDFWDYVENPLLDGLYQEFIYRDGVIRPPPPAGAPASLVTTNGILFENRLIGVPRLRQIRVRPDSCEIAPSFRRLIRQCFSSYSRNKEDTATRWKPYPGPAWTYAAEKELHGMSYVGRLATYSGSGSYLDFRIDDTAGTATQSAYDITKDDLRFLKNHHWITRATRVVFLDFTAYNANLNLFCFIKLVWELPPTGGVLTSWNIQTSNLLRYMHWSDLYIIFPCEIAFCVFTLFYFIQEIYEISTLGCCKYLKDIWSYVDISILLLSCVCISFSIVRYFVVQDVVAKLVINKHTFYNFEQIKFWHKYCQLSLAILAFFSWIRVFKYMSFNKTMTQLSATLTRCAKDVLGFAIMFFIVFIAFAQLGYLLFGAQVRDFSTLIDAIFTLLRLILGDFNFEQIEAANRVLGPLYFVAYVFFVFFVLLNMFLAIINDTFGEVKAEVQARRSEFEMTDYFKRSWNNMLGWFGKKDQKLDAKLNVKLASADGIITYEELRQNLKDAHFSDVEIEMFLARYELDHNRALDEDEIEHVLKELEGSRVSHGDGFKRKSYEPSFSVGTGQNAGDYIGNQVFQQEVEGLEKRITTMEASLSNIIYKIDSMVNKVERLK